MEDHKIRVSLVSCLLSKEDEIAQVHTARHSVGLTAGHRVLHWGAARRHWQKQAAWTEEDAFPTFLYETENEGPHGLNMLVLWKHPKNTENIYFVQARDQDQHKRVFSFYFYLKKLHGIKGRVISISSKNVLSFVMFSVTAFLHIGFGMCYFSGTYPDTPFFSTQSYCLNACCVFP